MVLAWIAPANTKPSTRKGRMDSLGPKSQARMFTTIHRIWRRTLPTTRIMQLTIPRS